MSYIAHRVIRYVAVPTVFLLGVFGCGAANNGLPEQVRVTLPGGIIVEAEEGSGAAVLANTSWNFRRVASNGQSVVFVTITFGDEGNLERFDNNTIASQIFGDTINFDGKRHNTSQAGLTYSAATYGAQSADAQDVAFAGRFTGFAAGIQAADGEASAIGSIDADDPTIMRGTFSFRTEVTLIDLPEGNQEDVFEFVAELVQE